MSLIIGDLAVSNVKTLFNAYSNYCLSSGNFHNQTYHPLMGLRKDIPWLTEEDWTYLANIDNTLDFSQKNLAILNTALTSIKSLTPLYGLNPRYVIDPNYDHNNPEAKNEFKIALSIFEQACPWQNDLFRLVIKQICPIIHRKNYRFDGGASDYNLIGMIFTGLKPIPHNLLNLGISIAHELGHNVFMLYQAGQYPIHESDFKKEVYSGVRRTNRPALAALHACVALGYMICFCESALLNLALDTSSKMYLEQEVLKYQIGLHDGLSAMNDIKLSELGNSILSELSEIIRS